MVIKQVRGRRTEYRRRPREGRGRTGPRVSEAFYLSLIKPGNNRSPQNITASRIKKKLPRRTKSEDLHLFSRGTTKFLRHASIRERELKPALSSIENPEPEATRASKKQTDLRSTDRTARITFSHAFLNYRRSGERSSCGR